VNEWMEAAKEGRMLADWKRAIAGSGQGVFAGRNDILRGAAKILRLAREESSFAGR
jgi:hypothetical protein